MERLVLLVEDEAERKFYETVCFVASAIRENGAADRVVPALRELFQQTRAWVPAGGAR
jgi:hypothetical protein